MWCISEDVLIINEHAIFTDMITIQFYLRTLLRAFEKEEEKKQPLHEILSHFLSHKEY